MRTYTRKSIRFWGVSLALILTVFVGLIVFLMQIQGPYMNEQKELAIKLGVEISDYPNTKSFPKGYFYSILKADMTVSEVHNIVKGFEKVYRCRSTGETYYREVYYYFSSRDTDALRFQIFYDLNGKLKNFQGEDEDSRTITINDCEEGLID